MFFLSFALPMGSGRWKSGGRGGG